MGISKREQKFIEEKYSTLRFSSDKKLIGSICVNCVHNDFPVAEEFLIEILIPKKYPNEIPSVKEVGGKISSSYEHLYTNGHLCLGTESDILMKCHGRITIDKLITNCLVSYFFSYRYHERFGVYPFGERSHGGEGIIESFMDILGVTDINEIVNIIKYAILNQYRGHQPCPCGSGNITRICHPISPTILSKLYSNKAIIAFMSKDYKVLEEEIKSYERYRKKAK